MNAALVNTSRLFGLDSRDPVAPAGLPTPDRHGAVWFGIASKAAYDEVDAAIRPRLRGDVDFDAEVDHPVLRRLKTAAALALLDDRCTIDDHDWMAARAIDLLDVEFVAQLVETCAAAGPSGWLESNGRWRRVLRRPLFCEGATRSTGRPCRLRVRAEGNRCHHHRDQATWKAAS